MTKEEAEASVKIILPLIASGYAGVDKTGMIVDRREHPDALPMQKNTLLNIPAPRPLES